MATKLKSIDTPAAASGADEYLAALVSLDQALQEERAAHGRLMALARRIEKQDARSA